MTTIAPHDILNRMINDLIIDKNIINSPQNAPGVPPYQIADKFRWLLINPDMTRDAAIQEIHDSYSKEFHKETGRYVNDINKNNSEKEKLNFKLQPIENELHTYMATAQKQVDIYENILQLRESLDALLPPKAREISNEYISEPERWAAQILGRMGFFEKIRFRRNGGLEKYNQIINTVHQAGLNFVPGNEDKARLAEQIKQKQKITDIKIQDIQKRIAELDRQIAISTTEINTVRQKYSDKMNHDISMFLSVFHDDPRERKSLRKIPPFVNMQNLTEPVAFFQNIDMPPNSVKQIATIMERAGLKVVLSTDGQGVSDPSTYILRSIDDYIELITPFYTPDTARENISAVLKHLAAHGIKLMGAAHPATRSQIDPQQDTPRSTAPDTIAAMVKNKLQNAISIDEFINQYRPNAKQGQFLFRGHNFITSDKNSSYATPTWRPGRSGLAYATEDPFYAYGYSGGMNTHNMAGETIKPQALHTTNGDIPVGFLTVYKRSNKNIMVDNTDLEYMDTRGRGAYKGIVQQEHKFPETVVSQTLNPVVARYLVSGDKIVKIDDNDPEWHQIMNYFAPDLNVTHTTQYGRDFIRRLDNIKHKMQENDGQVQTYNLTEEQLNKMVLPVDRQFHLGIKSIKKLSVQTPQMSDILQYSADMG